MLVEDCQRWRQLVETGKGLQAYEVNGVCILSSIETNIRVIYVIRL